MLLRRKKNMENWCYYPVLEYEFIKNMVRALESIDKEMENVELILFDSQDSIEKQLGDVDSMIVAEVDGILLNALSYEGTSSAVEAAKAAKIPLVEFISYTENTDYATFVGTDVKSSELWLEVMRPKY